MVPLPRHNCLIYEGPPTKHLAPVAAIMRRRLQENFRCLYLNSTPMIAGIRSYLAAAGVDVVDQEAQGSLILTSERHLVEGKFDVDRMLESLEAAFEDARAHGYAGLWATGDMTWEFGGEKNLSRLLEYEWQLEEFIRKHPEFGGVCQYHAETLPREYLLQGILTHPHLYVSGTLSRVNPDFLPREQFSPEVMHEPRITAALSRLLHSEGAD